MISNERRSPYGSNNYNSHNSHNSSYNSHHQPRSWAQMAPRPPVQEDTLKSSQLQIERKSFVFTLKENVRGRLLRITEDIGGRRNSIIIPSTGLHEFRQLLDEMIRASEELPPGKAEGYDQQPLP
jgi:hypothetical protein